MPESVLPPSSVVSRHHKWARSKLARKSFSYFCFTRKSINLDYGVLYRMLSGMLNQFPRLPWLPNFTMTYSATFIEAAFMIDALTSLNR